MHPDESDGWAASAGAWLREMGDAGDYGRAFVLDAPMEARVAGRGFETALDVGCGEGRFCRRMQRLGLRTVGIDPTAALIERARECDPVGDYRLARAETFSAPPASFDLIVSYLSLVDIPDLGAAAAMMAAALRPGGSLLIANLTSFNTAGQPHGWDPDAHGAERFSIDHYLDERAVWVSWRGIRIRNWHRPLSTYMAQFLGHGFELRYFAEPAPRGGDPAKAARYRRVPYFLIMEWQKPTP
jgi:SAM-dependent methyltransferase